MGVYDNRLEPAYQYFRTEPQYSENPHILKWWSPEHDKLLEKQIKNEQWVWYWGITDEIVANTPPEIIESWKREDPICSQYAWYNVLMYFAAARAEKLGLTTNIRKPMLKKCPLCNHEFTEDSLPNALVKRLGIDQLDFCAPCLRDTVLQTSGSNTSTKEEVLQHLRDLTEVLQRVPSQGYGEGMDDLRNMTTDERLALLKVLQKKPKAKRVKEHYGSWFEALIAAGIIEEDARRMQRGTQCLAKDGHVCLSLGEKTIDDTLNELEIPHEKEVTYPEGNYRADFATNKTFIEYFGLEGNPEYDDKTKKKMRICKKHKIMLIAIYPKDLTSTTNLKTKLQKAKAP